MHRPSLAWLLAALLPFVAFAPAAVEASGVRLSHEHGARHNGVFPFITWLRDSTIELIFGRPSKPTPAHAGHGPSQQSRYAHETVLRFNVTAPEEETALSEAAERLFLDVWALTHNFVDIRLHKDDVSNLLSLLPNSLQRSFSTLIPDLSSAVWATYPSAVRSKPTLDESGMSTILHDGIENIFFQDYQPLAVINRWMKLLESMFPSLIETISIGQSFEGREIYGIRLGETLGVDRGKKQARKTILITGGFHAREWISTSTVNYLTWSLVSAYGKEKMITKLLQHFDVVLVPVLNPDGYEYTWQTDRLWRKSRQNTTMRFCRGFDLDHAFGVGWNNTSGEPCSESYGGEAPFQATEAQALADWTRNQTKHNNAKFVGYLDLHSYSQQVLFPYAYSCHKHPNNLENLQELAVGIAKAIRLSSGENYGVTSACEGIITATGENEAYARAEPSGGSAIDWFYHEIRAKYSYQIKLRDTGSYGFLLPSEEIVPTGEEMFDAVKYFGDFLLGNNGIEKSIGAEAEAPVLQQEPLDEPEDEGWVELKRRRRRR